MRLVGFEQGEITSLQRVVMASLHLGNMTFEQGEEGEDSSQPTEASAYAQYFAANLLGLDQDALVTALCNKEMTVRGEVTRIPLDPRGAAAVRDSLVRAMYGRKFKRLIQRINEFTQPEYADHALEESLGILDIFGFEIFETNRFEQLCINYANEKLQQHFTNHVFKMQEELYAKEEVFYERTDYEDNQEVLELVEAKKEGLLSLLDDQVHPLSPSIPFHSLVSSP